MRSSQLEKKYIKYLSRIYFYAKNSYFHYSTILKHYFSRRPQLHRLWLCISKDVLLTYRGSETGFSSALGSRAKLFASLNRRPGALEMRIRRLSVLWTLTFYWFNLSPAKLVRLRALRWTCNRLSSVFFQSIIVFLKSEPRMSRFQDTAFSLFFTYQMCLIPCWNHLFIRFYASLYEIYVKYILMNLVFRSLRKTL